MSDADIIDTLAAIHRPQWWWDKSALVGAETKEGNVARSALAHHVHEWRNEEGMRPHLPAMAAMMMRGKFIIQDIASPNWRRCVGQVEHEGQRYTWSCYLHKAGEIRGSVLEQGAAPSPYYATRSVVSP